VQKVHFRKTAQREIHRIFILNLSAGHLSRKSRRSTTCSYGSRFMEWPNATPVAVRKASRPTMGILIGMGTAVADETICT